MPASPSAILRSWFERVWNAGDESAIDELYAANAVAHGLPCDADARPRRLQAVRPQLPLRLSRTSASRSRTSSPRATWASCTAG